MGCTLGRASLPSPDFIRQEGGGRLRVGHSGYAFSGSDGLVMAQQVTGYPNPDEEMVPFIYDATLAGGVLDGFYFVDSTNVDWAKLAAGMFSWEAVLVAVHSPVFEVSPIGGVRPNDHAVAPAAGWQVVPNASLVHTLRNSGTQSSALVGGGTVRFTGAGAYFGDGEAVNYEITPGSAYEGAPVLTMNDSEVTGRAILHDPDGWAVSNGIVKVRPSLTEANQFVVGVRNSGATSYDEKQYRFVIRSGGTTYEMGYDGSTRNAWKGVAVLHNDATRVSIRVSADLGNGKNIGGAGTIAGPSKCYIDLTIRRGGFVVEGRLTDVSTAGSLNWGLFRSSAETSVDITSGVEASVADGSGNKYRIYLPEANAVDTTNGGAYMDVADTEMAFGVGNDRTIYTGYTASDHYFTTMEHNQEIVGR